ncbi:hypothetical protein K732_11900 [Salmonella enterica subsp. enterica serovar Saintpaul str. S-70]|nr:hypothetical protein K732_11900 [Salmonella enterica subsp. enterica serovar Saintpaul str. S-70]
MRIGHGFDVHAFGGEGRLLLAACVSLMKKGYWHIPMAMWRYMR